MLANRQLTRSSLHRIAGIVGILYACLPSVTPATQDISPLVAELSQAWKQIRSQDIVNRFDEALRIAPRDYRLHKAYGNFLTTLRRNLEALAAYRHAAELAPDALDVHWAMWSLLDRMGNQDQAILSLKEVVRLDPDNPLVHLRLAKALRNVDRLEESVQSYQNAVTLAPDHMTYRLQYARALFDVLQYDAARREVESVLARAPKDTPEWAAAQNLIGVVRGDSSDKGRRTIQNKNIKRDGVNLLQWGKAWVLARGKAWQLMREERHAEAAMALQDVLKINPEDDKAFYDLGLTLMELGRYKEALGSFEDVIRLDKFGSWYPDSLFQSGRCLAAMGRWAEALARFARVIEIEDWRDEFAYAMNFPDLAKVRAALTEANQHVSPSQRIDATEIESRNREKKAAVPKVEEYPIPPLGDSRMFAEPIAFPTQVATLGAGDAQGWFRQMVPTRGVAQDDLPTGLQEFMPIEPTDSFFPDDPEVIIVFTLTTSPPHEIMLKTRWVAERAGGVTPGTVVGTDAALLTFNDKSGYVRLRRPKDGWPIGIYRVDFYLGDQINAYTHTAEARFRVVAKASP
jgi:tetratricopeptide (TPR) repeat protein